MAQAARYDDDFEDDSGTASDGGAGGQIDLQHYLRVLRKHKWAITLFTAAVTGLAAYYAYTATPVYSATATLLIEPQGSNPVSIEGLVGVDIEAQDYYETQFELLKSRQLAFRVLDTLDLWNDPELTSGGAAVSGLPADATMSAAEEGPTVDDAATDPASVTSADAGTGAGSDVSGADGMIMPELSIEDALGEIEVTPEQQQVLGNFMSRLTVAPVRKTKLVKISYESTDPAHAARVANTVGEQYIESYLDAKMELTTKAATWLNGRLQSLKETLDESEDRLIAFKQENGLVDVDGSVGRLNEQELLLLTSELAQARSELSASADVYRETQALASTPELLESIPAIASNPLVQQVKIEQGQAQRQLDELMNRYGERHPRVVDARSQLASLDTTLNGYISRVVGSIAKDYQLLQQRVSTIQQKLASGKQEIQAIGGKKFELDALEREVSTNQGIYDTFFNRMTEARSADGLDNANARVADQALPPNSPVKPKKQLIIALAALASLVLSMLMAILYEQMDDTIKGTSDVEGKLGVRLLGILPLIKGGMFSRKGNSSLPLDPTSIVDKKGTFAESVNTVRTALSLGGTSETPNQVVMVTSSIPGEGKSTVSLNLAYSMAQLERVLIIDCDLRRPTLGVVAGHERGVKGLSDLIMGTAQAKECIRRGQFDGALDVLPAGRSTDQPLELLSSRRFEKILEQLRQHYDRIVLDCAPTQAVSDSLVISKLADSVVFAIKSHETSMELARRGLERLGQVKARIAGVVITQVDIDKITSYGGDHYYQGYYDYYGYTDAGEKQRSERLRLSQEDLISLNGDDHDVALDLGYDRPASRGTTAPAPRTADDTWREPDARPAEDARGATDDDLATSSARDFENARPPSRPRLDDAYDADRAPPARERTPAREPLTRRRMSDDLDII